MKNTKVESTEVESTGEKPRLTNLFPEEITEVLGLETFQGRQIFSWIHGKQVFDPWQMTDLAKRLRQRLVEETVPSQTVLLRLEESAISGTQKALLGLTDEQTVESVRIPGGERRITICVSSQVGCPLKCSFCATGLAGFVRNLQPGEIVEQVLHFVRREKDKENHPNIVFMGMGEPFRNYENVVRAIRLLMHPLGLHIGARKITVSTAGEVGGILKFAHENWQVRLSISLHAANNTLRNRLVPLNRRYPLERLRAAVDEYIQITGRQVTFEWTLLEGVNDRIQDVEELSAFLEGLKATVNVIPWNPVTGIDYRPPSPERVRTFTEALNDRGIKTTVRVEKGQDIEAACGQLRRVHAMQEDRANRDASLVGTPE
jgi:23S rRNA (adenine2503-C2)-methyltransferase